MKSNCFLMYFEGLFWYSNCHCRKMWVFSKISIGLLLSYQNSQSPSYCERRALQYPAFSKELRLLRIFLNCWYEIFYANNKYLEHICRKNFEKYSTKIKGKMYILIWRLKTSCYLYSFRSQTHF